MPGLAEIPSAFFYWGTLMRKSAALFLSLSLTALASSSHAQGNDPGAPNVWAITDAKIPALSIGIALKRRRGL